MGQASVSDRILTALRRVTTSGSFLPEVDGLRFLAIVSVLLVHLLPPLVPPGADFVSYTLGSRVGGVLNYGRIGVQLFFTISAFILSLPFAEHALAGGPRVGLKRYFVRRVTRLEPPYIICCLALFALQAFRCLPGESGYPDLVASLCYSHTLAFGRLSPINTPFWSLEVEVQFYVFVPLLTRVFLIGNRRARRALIVGTMLAIGAVQTLFPGPHMAYYTIYRQINFFLGGLLLADWYVADWRGNGKRAARWDLVTTAALACIFPVVATIDVPSSRYGLVVMPFLVVAAYMGVFRGVYWRRFFTNRWVTAVGGMCYTIYLYHNELILQITRLTRPLLTYRLWLDVIIQGAIVLPPVIAISALLYILFEKPFMYRDWPERVAAVWRAWVWAPLARAAGGSEASGARAE
jgi:peptidoglycan/LPS O-acetylase OafA/YrhL